MEKDRTGSQSQLEFEILFFERLVEQKPNYVEALIPLADAYTKKGFFKKGLELDKRLSLLCPEDESVFYNLACSYALTGDSKKAFEALETAIRLGYSDPDHMLKDSDLDPLKKHPDFSKLIKKICLRESN